MAAFLADQYASHLVPESNAAGGALKRAQIAFFVDAFFSKFQSHLFKLYSAKSDEEASPVIEGAVASLVKEVEPLLKDAAPFFGGSDKLTLAEVLTRLLRHPPGLAVWRRCVPAQLPKLLEEKAPNFWKWAGEVSKHSSVTKIYDEEAIVRGAKARIAKLRAAA